MTPDIIANIFLGTITKWNDPAIAAANPGVTLPDTRHQRRPPLGRLRAPRASSRSTSPQVSPDWVTTVGGGDPTKSAGKTVEWPTGLGASGNEGVTQGINQTDGGVGYIELAYALANKIPFADGRRTSPAPSSCRRSTRSKAAADLPSLPGRPAVRPGQHGRRRRLSDRRHDLADRVQGPVEDDEEPGPRQALVDFLWWAIHDGQADCRRRSSTARSRPVCSPRTRRP